MAGLLLCTTDTTKSQAMPDLSYCVHHPCHLLHVAFGDELLQLGDLTHPVEDAPARHVEDLGSCILREHHQASFSSFM